MEKRESADIYLTHSAGILNMLAWFEEQRLEGTPCKVIKETVYIHPLSSRYFALSISRSKKFSNTPFLAMQLKESSWIRMIEWDRICIRQRDMHLYLISKVVKGDGSEYPDIPSFAVALSFDMMDKIRLLEKIDILEGREFYEQNEGLVINTHSTVFRLKVHKLKYDESYLLDEKVRDYTDLLRDKEIALQSVFSTDAPPEFKGDVVEIPGTEDLFKKLKDKLL
jgi:hypothetical protein